MRMAQQRFGIAVAPVATALLAQLALAQASPPGVFAEVRTAITPLASPALEPATLRSRLVQLDTQRITAARRGREVLQLNLFDDAVVEVDIKRVRPTRNGYFISGTPKGMNWGEVRLVVNGPVMVGTVVTPESKFTIRSGGGGRHVIRQIDPAKESLVCEVETDTVAELMLPQPDLPAISSIDPVQAGALSPAAYTEDVPTEDGSEVRILIVYTPAMQAEQGGSAGIKALIDLFIESANEAFDESGINTRLVLAHAAMLDYVATGRDLEALITPNDGHLDEVHALRNEHAADLVHLLTNVVTAASGSATRPRKESLSLERTHGFAFTANGSEETFTHEVGHNFGLKHDRYSVPNFRDATYPYAYGYQNNRAFEPAASYETQWRTIMAYSDRCGSANFSCPRLFRFSNPDQTHNGDPLGVPADEPSTGADGPADARLAVNKTARWVASYRSEACTDYTITPQPAIAIVDGGEITLKVDTVPGCLWNASSDADFLTVASDTKTAGSGFVQVTVEANNGDAERNGTVTVAGQSITVRQLATSEGICDRTPAVAGAIAKAVGLSGVGRCDQVNDEHLAGITELGLSRQGISSLRSGDFAGLTSLRFISLNNNELTVLPAGLFAGLSSLESVAVNFNPLTELPEVLFAGLSGLKGLYLDNSELSHLPVGLFAGLSNLEWLSLNHSRLTDLPEGLFAGLHRLRYLNLQSNALTQVPGGLFAGLSSLEELNLGFNSIRHLPAGLFSGLSMLSYLELESNRLTNLNEQQFGGLARLEHLRLGGNELASLPAGVFRGLTSLQTLELGHNRLPTLPAGLFAGLSNLQALDLDYNQLTEFSNGQFTGLSGLRTLRARQNELRSLEVDVLSGLSALEELDLFGNDLSQLGQTNFSNSPALVTLNLGGNRLRNLPDGLFSGLSSIEEIRLSENSLQALPRGIFSNLSSLRKLYLTANQLTGLPDDAFAGLSQLRFLRLAENRLTDLPAGTFSGLSSLENLDLTRNQVDPLSFSLSLEKAGDSRFKVTMPVGAPFEMVISVSISDSGQLEDGAHTVTIPAGATGSDELQVERVPGREDAVSVEIGALPLLPPAHRGYILETISPEPVWVLPSLRSTDATLNALSIDGALLEPPFSPENTAYKAYVPHEATSATVSPTTSNSGATVVLLDAGDMELRDADLSTDGHQAAVSVGENMFRVRVASEDETVTRDYTIQIIRDEATNVCVRTPEVRNVIMKSTGVDACEEVSADHLSRIQFLDLDGHALFSLEAGDFAGLSGIDSLYLANNRLSKLQGDVFRGLDQLRILDLSRNQLASLPVGIFSGLPRLESMDLSENALPVLPEGVFSGLNELKTLWLSDNRLASLPARIFSDLNSLEILTLNRNALQSLPADAFSSLHSLKELILEGNTLRDLPAEIFMALSSLETLSLSANPIGDIATDQLVGLTTLKNLNLGDIKLKQLPPDFLAGFRNLEFIGLWDNEIATLPPGLFSSLSGLREINLSGNQLNDLPAGIFSGLSGLFALYLDENRLGYLPDSIFSGLSGLDYLYLGGNRIDPLPLPLSLEKTGESKFKAVVPAGAPFDMSLAVTISSAGEIDALGSTVSISAGALESAAVGVKRLTGATEAVTVDFAELPVLPRFHQGYTLEQDESLPRTILSGPGAQPPAQVTGVQIAPGPEQLEVTWSAVSEANGYKVQWKSGDEDYDDSRQALVSGGESTKYTFTGLTAGTEYTVRVIATVTDSEDGAPSSEVTATPKAVAPSQVTGVAITAGEEELTVSWIAVSDADGYKVQWKSGVEEYGESRQAVVSSGDLVRFTITALTPGTEYTVRVIATKAHADDGEPSDEVSGIPRAMSLDQVMGVAVVAGVEQLAVSWDAVSDADGYKVQWKSGDEDYAEDRQVALLGGETTSYTIIDLTVDTEYTIRVIATKDHADDGEPSEEVTGTPASPDPDVNADGTLDGDDAQVMYQAYASEEKVGDGESGGTAASRRTLLSGLAGTADPSDDDLKAMLRKANVWRSVGVAHGGDINEDGAIDGDDAFVMYYAYEFADLVGDGETGGTARHRQHLLASRAGKDDPSDDDLKRMLRRANKLREDFG